MTYVQFANIVDELGLQEGDVVLVGSDIMRLLIEARRHGEKADGNMMIDRIQTLIGESGTLLLPTYNWDFCNGVPFDIRNTPSKTGSLSNLALKRNDFKRTQHPIYSFAVWGKGQAELCGLTNSSAFGADSPFAYLYQKKAKMLMIGVGYANSFTFVHYVEEMEQVDFRYMKQFTGLYIDEEGREEQRTYSMFVRDLERGVHSIFPEELAERMESSGASKPYVINGVQMYTIDLEQVFSIVQDEIRNNDAKLLYKAERSI